MFGFSTLRCLLGWRVLQPLSFAVSLVTAILLLIFPIFRRLAHLSNTLLDNLPTQSGHPNQNLKLLVSVYPISHGYILWIE